MSDQISEAAPVVDEQAAPEATIGSDAEQTTTPPVDGSGSENAGDVTAKLKKEAQQQRAARRAAEAEAAELRAKVEAAEREKLSDLEKAQADAKAAHDRAEAAEQRARTASARSAITAAAPGAKIDPGLAVELLASRVEFDDQGEPVGVAELLADLASKHPSIVQRSGPSAGGAPGAASPGSAPVAESREARNKRLGIY